VPSSVATELRRIDPSTVVILGGTGAVSASVEAQVESILTD